MSKRTICDITGCEEIGEPYEVMFTSFEIEPTGDSDYSSVIKEYIRVKWVDLCDDHEEEFKKRLKTVMTHSEAGFGFPNESK
jgi:hypothetical protein